jgi:hypothetical protein
MQSGVHRSPFLLRDVLAVEAAEQRAGVALGQMEVMHVRVPELGERHTPQKHCAEHPRQYRLNVLCLTEMLGTKSVSVLGFQILEYLHIYKMRYLRARTQV